METKKEASKRRVKVKTLDNQIFTFEAPPEILISEFKKQIEASTHIKPPQQRLIFKARLLKDEQKLSEFVQEDDETIHLIARQEGPPQAAPQPQPQPGSAQAPPRPPNPFGDDPFFSQLGSMMSQLLPHAQALAGQLAAGGFPGQPGFVVNSFPVPARPPAPPMSPPMPAPSHAPGSPDVSQEIPRISLPSEHVLNIGSYVNSLSGPNSSFPEPFMPQLNVPRNSLSSIGIFLYNYQFQLLRLIPFISRLADLFQRESLLANPRERAQAQWIANHVGMAMHEVIYSTIPVAHLVRDIQLGDSPGSFRLVNTPNRDLAPFVASLIQEPPHRPASEEVKVSEGKEKELISGLEELKKSVLAFSKAELSPMLKAEESQAMQKAKIASLEEIKKIDSIISLKSWHKSIAEVIGLSPRPSNLADQIIEEIAKAITIYDCFEIQQGNYAAFAPLLSKVFTKVLGEAYSPDARIRACKKIGEELKKAIKIPPHIQESMLQGFEPHTVIAEIVEKYGNGIAEELVDFEKHKDKKKLAEKIVFLLTKIAGECVTELLEGFSNSFPVVEALLKHSVKMIIEKIDCGANGLILSHIATGPLCAFIKKASSEYQKEEEKAKASKKPTPEEEKKKPVQKAATEEKKATEQHPGPGPVAVAAKPTQQKAPLEEVKAAPATQKTPEKWKEVFDKDMEAQKAIQPQRPYSYAYLATDPSRGPHLISKPRSNYFEWELREAMKLLKMKNEDIGEVIEDINDDLRNAYVKMVQTELKQRVSKDPDYNEDKHKFIKKLIEKESK